MDDFIARKPILNIKTQVYGYHLILGQSILDMIHEDSAPLQDDQTDTPSMFMTTINGLSDSKPAYIDFFEALESSGAPDASEKNRRSRTVVVFGKNTSVNTETCSKLKEKGYQLAFDSSFFSRNDPAVELADVIAVEFTSVNLSVQAAFIKTYKRRLTLLAGRIETWSDYKVARDMGYDLFQGFFFLWPAGSLVQKEIKSLDACLVAILLELDKPEPSFKNISDMIEHDLGLSYKLLRLVNSAYMAPKYKIKSISQALTFLGTRELYQWISMLMFNGIKSEDNSELVVMSLIRGKLMALIAQELRLGHVGSEPFFIGLFSLIDVILNRDMNNLLAGLPLTEEIKNALLGGSGVLTELLTFVVNYEQAEWSKIEGKYPLNKITPQRMAAFYTEAHKWSKLMDFQA